MDSGFDEDKYYLGKLCKRGHDWQGTGQSLRKKCDCGCLECTYFTKRERRRNQPEKVRAKDKEYRDRHREQLIERSRQYYYANKAIFSKKAKAYRAENHEAIKAQQKRYREANPQKLREQRRRYYLKNREKRLKDAKLYRESARDRRRFLQNRRRLRMQANQEPYSEQQLKEHFSKWDGRCAYCGAPEQTIDHFHPVFTGGADALSNIVPACKICNCSKHANDAWDWYVHQPFFSQERWDFIQQILSDT